MKDTKKMTMKEKALYYEEMAKIEENVKTSIHYYNSDYEEKQTELNEIEKETIEQFDGDTAKAKEALENNWRYTNTITQRDEYGLRIRALNQILENISEM